jgi:ubiquinone/menaquinone biosynthesis C-methylase UbiE
VNGSPAEYFSAVQATAGWDRMLESFAGFCRVQAGWRVLDVGCGPGGLARHLAALGCVPIGLDRDMQMALLASRSIRAKHACLQADAHRLPFAAERFDLVTATNVVFLLDRPQDGLAEFARVVRQGGRLAMLNPSEHLSARSAAVLADERGLTGVERTSLLGWARIAEERERFSESDTRRMIEFAGCQIIETGMRMGPGFARLTLAERTL